VSDKNPQSDSFSSIFKIIKSRRVTRNFSDDPVPVQHICVILEAARWAPSGGKRWLNNYVVIRETDRLRKIRSASPGILGFPQAIILICIDTAKLKTFEINDSNQGSIFVDLGTAAENMLLTAAELGIGACPVMSFHKPAIQILLNLPVDLIPAMMILLGFPASHESDTGLHSKLPKLYEIAHWEHIGGKIPC
jgi:nitroreductase